MKEMVPNCPVCNEKLKIIKYGYLREGIDMTGYVSGGCCCFGDERDEYYACTNCKNSFGKNLKTIHLIDCPAITSGAIFPEDCKNFENMKAKNYRILDDPEKICQMICPMIRKNVIITLFSGEQFAGKCMSTNKGTDDKPNDTLFLYSLTDINPSYISLPICEIESIEPVKFKYNLHIKKIK